MRVGGVETTQCNTLQHTAAHYNTLRFAATHSGMRVGGVETKIHTHTHTQLNHYIDFENSQNT